MSKGRSSRDNVTTKSLFNYWLIVQFEEKKFLETAKKIIQGSVANAGSKLDNDRIA